MTRSTPPHIRQLTRAQPNRSGDRTRLRSVRRHIGNRTSFFFPENPPRRKFMKLRRNEFCPIHRSISCCGRELVQKGSRVRRLGVQRIEDPHHPRGYRELRSKGEMRKLLNRKIVEQNRQCAICEVAFTNYGDIVPDHIDPRGMGGSRRDDHPENIQAAHFWCNGEKGSTREY